MRDFLPGSLLKLSRLKWSQKYWWVLERCCRDPSCCLTTQRFTLSRWVFVWQFMYHNCYTVWKSRQTSIIQDINLAYFIIKFVWQVEDFNWNLGKKYWLAISSPRQGILQSLGFLTSSSSLSPPERFSGPWKSPQKVKVQKSLQTNARTSTYSKRFQVKLPTQTPDKHGGTSTCDQHGDLGTHAPVNTLMLYWNNNIHYYVLEPYTPPLTHTATTLCTVMYQNLVYLLYHTLQRQYVQ